MNTRRKLWKRMGGVLLAMAMILSLLPVSALAVSVDLTATFMTSSVTSFDGFNDNLAVNPRNKLSITTPPFKSVVDGKIDLWVSSTDMSSDNFCVPYVVDDETNETWYLQQISLSNMSVVNLNGGMYHLMSPTAIKSAKSENDYIVDLNNIEIDFSPFNRIYSIYYLWTLTPPEEWSGDPINPPKAYTVSYDPNTDFFADYTIKAIYCVRDDEGTKYIQITDQGIDLNEITEHAKDQVTDNKPFKIGDQQYYNYLVVAEPKSNPDGFVYFELEGWKGTNNTTYDPWAETADFDALADNKDAIEFTAQWKQIEMLTDEELANAEETLPLNLFDGINTTYILYQWTDTDPNLRPTGTQSGDPVTLDEDGTLYYQLSARFASDISGAMDGAHTSFGDDFADLTLKLTFDENLEFAEKNVDGTVSIFFNCQSMKPTEINVERAVISQKSDDNTYTITFDPAKVARTSSGEMDIQITLKSVAVSGVDAFKAPFTVTGLQFKLKEGVSVDPATFEVNSSANITGTLNIKGKSPINLRNYFSTAKKLLSQYRSTWETVMGGDSNNPAALVRAAQFIDYKANQYDLLGDKQAVTKANPVIVTYPGTVTVTPANITIYMGGDGGYDAVVGENGEIASSTNSLPHPLFIIKTPDGIDPADLTFTNGDDTWTVECDNPTSEGTKYYHFVPDDGTDDVRVTYTYTDKDNVEHTVTSDAFNPTTMGDVFAELKVELYPGTNNMSQVRALADNGLHYVTSTSGTLTVRAVANNDPTSDIATTAPTKTVASGTAVAVAPADTIYTLNNTGAPLPPVASGTNPNGSKPSLLFDSIINDAEHNRTGALEDKVDEKLGAVGSNTTRHYEIKYLDLVDANNGNAWITSSKGTDIYWGYPETTGQGTTFKLLHFKGLHRDNVGGNSGFDITDISGLDVENVEVIEVENTGTGIKFHVDAGGFSPFALVWETTSSGGTGTRDDYTLHYVVNGGEYVSSETHSSPWTKPYEELPIPVRDGYTFEGWYTDLRLTEPVTGDIRVDSTTVDLYAKWSGGKDYGPDDTGVSNWLETGEHNAFLSGYPDSTFGPDKNMTRAEVAQMFYALLRDKNVAVTASFSDVPADAWYAKAVNTLSSLGMLGGYPDGTFRPDAPITRAEFAAIALAFAYDPTNASCSYTDVSTVAWYYTYVAQATTYGWIGGYPDGSFRPNNSITRAEVAVIVNNMLGRSADERYIDRNADDLVNFVDLSTNHWAYYTIMEATNSHDYTTSSNGESWK